MDLSVSTAARIIDSLALPTASKKMRFTRDKGKPILPMINRPSLSFIAEFTQR
jgi:hypothetical protein